MSERICLQHVDESRNMRRFYVLDIQPNLFGEWVLVRENGRIGSPGRVIEKVFNCPVEAQRRFAQLMREKTRKGYQ
ncbi:hypothetical protein NS365_07455 [Aureimonas ureilytica]|uniref:WGR domain-containing protein n=1 Tax=Aureimonas ureilytica TaxID=401562 RepID=A0A175RRY6_9HYPH|nr:WGR domain-containing protein [Aureimonas ureilytica]KTR06456.1 hypothetical protein NS365_07455 [Aureimonas ureilytica]